MSDSPTTKRRKLSDSDAVPPPATTISTKTASINKPKTAAKKRYLKRKKIRRKAVLASAPKKRRQRIRKAKEGEEGEGDEKEAGEEDGSGDESDSSSGSEAEADGEDDSPAEEQPTTACPLPPAPAPVAPAPADTAPTSPPHKKKRKKNRARSDSPAPPLAPDSPSLAPAASPSRSLSPAPAPLTAFPLPINPSAPSAEELASLGIPSVFANETTIEPASSVPVSSAGALGLGEKLRARLADVGVEELFAVQLATLPLLTHPPTLYPHPRRARDLCVSAPTGSGKTLGYVLPVVEVLSRRTVTRLRALVILPTRDLVAQVRETFEAFCKGTGLKIGVATGQHSFTTEQSRLVADLSSPLLGGSSKVDILIATPGRLMDHLNSTPNFSLQHLRFLIIDEADRLLNQSFQEWLPNVLSSISAHGPQPQSSSSAVSLFALPVHDALAPSELHATLGAPTSDLHRALPQTVQKLLFSATLTKDPAKIAALQLYSPRFISVRAPRSGAAVAEEFAVPSTLKEHMIVSPSTLKPLVLLHLLHTVGVSNALCFTKSVESVTRLVHLVNFFEDLHHPSKKSKSKTQEKKIVVKAYTSDLSPADRTRMLAAFRAGEIDVLVCSDLIARGIDIASVAHVVSYDVPVDMRKYVHRVGRTARAGREGSAWSLVEEQEARYFKKMLADAGHAQRVKKVNVQEKETEGLMETYEAALGKLKELYVRQS